MTANAIIFDTIRDWLDQEGFTPARIRALDAACARFAAAVAGQGGAGGNASQQAPIRPSAAGIALMHEFEGCEKRRADGRLEAYPDPGSRDGHPWTIGWGSTGPGIERGTTWTQEQADARFEQDLARFALGVVRLLDGARTTQPQFDALTSLAYNIGIGALRDSTLLRLHKQGDFEGAANQFRRWNRNDGEVMAGLSRRRAAEEAMYRSGVPT